MLNVTWHRGEYISIQMYKQSMKVVDLYNISPCLLFHLYV